MCLVWAQQRWVSATGCKQCLLAQICATFPPVCFMSHSTGLHKMLSNEYRTRKELQESLREHRRTHVHINAAIAVAIGGMSKISWQEG